jgi:methylmalonyl-CoA/ethylmalonyl-CoA epimerase
MVVLDHFAIGTARLADGWDLFGGVLGGTWAYGGDSPGYWWGQLRFGTGPKIELLTPTGGPDAAFLERFLAGHGPGAHHFNFATADIAATMARIRAAGIEPVQVSLDGATWKELFLHPRSAHGIVIQVVQEDGPRAASAAPADLPAPGAVSEFSVIEHHVSDLAGATRLFAEALDGAVTGRGDGDGGAVAELAWPGGGRIRLVQPPPPAGDGLPNGGVLRRVGFTRPGAPVTAADAGRVAELSGRLGLTVELASRPES